MWKKAFNLTAGAPFLMNPVNISLRKSASLTKKRLFTETFDTLKTIWTEDDLRSGSESYEILNPPKGKNYINYYSPVLAGNDSVIAVKTSLTDPPSFVLIKPSEKSEERIHIPGRMSIHGSFRTEMGSLSGWKPILIRDGRTETGR